MPQAPPGRLPEVGPGLAAALEDRWESYRAQLQRCQRSFSGKAVHDLRVATRRLLAQFGLLECVMPGAAPEKARRVLKRRVTALGDLRDTHVQRLFIEQRLARFPELMALRGSLQRRERRLVKSAAKKVNGWKTRKLERSFAALAKDLTAGGRGARARGRLTSAVLRATAAAFAEAVKRRQAIDLADLRTVHQTRVAFKRFRYMVESLSPALTGLSKRQLRALAYYQRKMGIIQDLEVIQACAASYLGDNPKREKHLRSFCRYLRQRRARAMRSFVKSADRLFDFWPPAKLAASGHSPATRKTA